MQEFVQEFLDNYGDPVQVEFREVAGMAGEPAVYVNTPNQSEDYEFSVDSASKLAHAILDVIEEDTPTRAQVSAKALTFNEGVVRLAAIHGKTVEFRYVKSDKHAPELRRLVPSGVVGQGEHLRFTGYDTDRDATRAFRLDRIKGDVGVVA